jgi:hypothetical protein
MGVPDGLCESGLSLGSNPDPVCAFSEPVPRLAMTPLTSPTGVSPGGRLDISDLRPEMLDHSMRSDGERGLMNITPSTRGERWSDVQPPLGRPAGLLGSPRPHRRVPRRGA